EDRPQAAVGERGAQVFLEGVDDAGAGKRGTDFQVLRGTQQRTPGRHPEGVPVAFELPGRELAALETVADQAVPGEVARGLRGAVAIEVGGCSRGGEALPARSDRDGDHVPRQAFLVAHAGVVAGGQYVDVGVVHRHL